MTDHALVTQNDAGHISILLFNPCLEPTTDTVEIKLQLPVSYEESTVCVQKVDEVNGNAYAAWRTLGSPRIPLRHEMDIIKRAQYPAMEIYALKQNEQGMLEFDTHLPANGIQLIEITPRRDQTSSYQGLQEKYYRG